MPLNGFVEKHRAGTSNSYLDTGLVRLLMTVSDERQARRRFCISQAQAGVPAFQLSPVRNAARQKFALPVRRRPADKLLRGERKAASA